MKELPQRKNLRFEGYDYSQNGLYFITFCIHNKNCYLGRINGYTDADGSTGYRFVPSKAGEIVKAVIDAIQEKFTNTTIESHCIMPNHVHMIFGVMDDAAGSVRPRSLLSKAIGFLKMQSAKQIRLDNPYIPGVWQRGYHDHIIRDEKDNERIMRYIETNIQCWKEDVYYMQDEKITIGKIGMNVCE
jgi:putative transposase